MSKFHVNADGNVYECFAKTRPCPLGGEDQHYSNPETARAAFEQTMRTETLPDGRKGFSVTESLQIGDRDLGDNRKKFMPIKKGFTTREDAIKWAEENLADSSNTVLIMNDDYEESDKSSSVWGNDESWKPYKIDVSREMQTLRTRDIPKIGQFYLKNEYVKNAESIDRLRFATFKSKTILNKSEYGRLLGYLKAATYGKKNK